MTIYDFNIICTDIFPNEANSPLVIDANRMLPLAVPAQSLQPIIRRDPQIHKGVCRHQVLELPVGNAFKGT